MSTPKPKDPATTPFETIIKAVCNHKANKHPSVDLAELETQIHRYMQIVEQTHQK